MQKKKKSSKEAERKRQERFNRRFGKGQKFKKQDEDETELKEAYLNLNF